MREPWAAITGASKHAATLWASRSQALRTLTVPEPAALSERSSSWPEPATVAYAWTPRTRLLFAREMFWSSISRPSLLTVMSRPARFSQRFLMRSSDVVSSHAMGYPRVLIGLVRLACGQLFLVNYRLKIGDQRGPICRYSAHSGL